MTRTLAFAALLCGALSACATNRIAQPASAIENSVTRFHEQLSNFQQSIEYLQKGERDRIAFLNIQRQAALVTVAYQQTLWAVEDAGTAAKVFVALRDQARFMGPTGIVAEGEASGAMPSPRLALGKLVTVVHDLQGLSKPQGRLADIKFMAGYVNNVKQDISAAATKSSGPKKDVAHP